MPILLLLLTLLTALPGHAEDVLPNHAEGSLSNHAEGSLSNSAEGSRPNHDNGALPNHAVGLLYHHISDDTPAITSTSPARFAEQLAYLAEHDYQVMELEAVAIALQQNQPLPDKVVSITFDDGYRSVYDNAFPLLKQYGWPFTVFVNTEAVDGGYGSHSNWDQLREMATHGATIANHSHSHDHLAYQAGDESLQQWQQRIRQDLQHAQQRITAETGQQSRLFAYPYGEFSPALQRLVTELGYIGLGQHSGAMGPDSDFSALPRFPIAGPYADMKNFPLKASSLPLPVKTVTAKASPLAHHDSQPSLTLALRQKLPGLQCYGSGQGRLQQQWLNPAKTAVLITPLKPIPVGRSRYNCTAPAGQQRYYWYSQAWIRLTATGQWVLD